jgi:small-conductance mechanosensitive channel
LVLLAALPAAAQASPQLNVLLPKTGSAANKSPASRPESKATVEPIASTPAAQTQPQNSLAIPLPDIAARSQELLQTLQSTSNNLPDREQLKAIEAEINNRESILTPKLQEVQTLLKGTPSSLELREQETYWRGLQAYGIDSRKQLLGWANGAQSAVQLLNLQEPQWVATREAARSTPGIGPVLDVIDDSLASIRRLRIQAQDDLGLIVNMQIKATAQDQTIVDVLNRLTKAKGRLKGHLMDRDSLPLWQVALRRQEGESSSLYGSASARWIAITAFAHENRVALVLLALLWFVSTSVAYRLHHLMRRGDPSSQRQLQLFGIVQHWFALGMLPPLLLSYLLASTAPLALIGVTILVSFLLILLLLPPLVEPPFRVMLYYMAGLYLLNALVQWILFSPVLKREIQFLTIAAVTAIFGWLMRPSRTQRLEPQNRHRQLLVLGIRLAVALMGLSLVANLLGYLKLAQFLAVACIYSGFIGVSAFTGYKVFTLLLVAGLGSQPAQRLAIVRQHAEGICRWVPRLMGWAGILLWFWATLDLFAIRDGVVAWLSAVLNFRMAPSSGGITLGQVLGFFVIILLGYALSRAVRFVLREEILSHFQLPRGIPELISTGLHYLILVLVFLAAMRAGGVEMNKFTVLTGALGVGVGFGLQNIVNNFVSGLILQFERPIHIGDVLELDPGVAGTVTRIGIRSSTILTAQGAEIIVPNSSFVSNRVTNWTLTEAERRVELAVGVAYGSDLKLVTQLLYQAAATHESVLTKPTPVAYFKEFGDSSLNFELQFWVKIESNWVRVRSEVSMVVVMSLEKAGIEIPFPQRDLRLRSVNPPAAEALANGGSSSATTSADEGNRYDISSEAEPTRHKH